MLWCSRKLVTPLECALTKNAPANPLESAHTISLDLKPFGMNRCKKRWGEGRCSANLVPPSMLRTQPAFFNRGVSTVRAPLSLFRRERRQRWAARSHAGDVTGRGSLHGRTVSLHVPAGADR